MASALALFDTNEHALSVDVADLERDHLARTKPGAIGER
jgi:hypothetical protein